MAHDPLRSDPVIGKLKRMRGLDHVVLDDEKKITVPKAGNRWRKLADIMGGLAWSTCEAFDKDGALVGVVENADVADDDGDDGAAEDRPVTVGDLAKVLVNVVRDVMQETRLMFQAQMDGNARIIEGMSEANRNIADSYSMALKVASATGLAGATEGQSPEVMEMLKLAMPMMMMSRSQPQQPAQRRQPARDMRPRMAQPHPPPTVGVSSSVVPPAKEGGHG